MQHPSGRALAELRRQTSFFRRRPGDLSDNAVESEVSPDYGPNRPCDRSGITVCGASEYVVNFNIALDTQDLSACKRIATAIRATSTGGQEGTSSPMRTPALHAASRVF